MEVFTRKIKTRKLSIICSTGSGAATVFGKGGTGKKGHFEKTQKRHLYYVTIDFDFLFADLAQLLGQIEKKGILRIKKQCELRQNVTKNSV